MLDKTSTDEGLTFLNFFHQLTPIGPTTKTIRVHVCSATNPTDLSKKLKMAPATLLTIAGNASTAFPSLLRAFANLSNHFFKALSSFGREPPVPPPPPKAPVTASTIVQIVIQKGSQY